MALELLDMCVDGFYAMEEFVINNLTLVLSTYLFEG